jgi:hypothetical protein
VDVLLDALGQSPTDRPIELNLAGLRHLDHTCMGTLLTGDDFRVFGQNGAGGYAAFWLVRHDEDLADQPIVFLGSEGETAVVARDLPDVLRLLAGLPVR